MINDGVVLYIGGVNYVNAVIWSLLQSWNTHMYFLIPHMITYGVNDILTHTRTHPSPITLYFLVQ